MQLQRLLPENPNAAVSVIVLDCFDNLSLSVVISGGTFFADARLRVYVVLSSVMHFR